MYRGDPFRLERHRPAARGRELLFRPEVAHADAGDASLHDPAELHAAESDDDRPLVLAGANDLVGRERDAQVAEPHERSRRSIAIDRELRGTVLLVIERAAGSEF